MSIEYLPNSPAFIGKTFHVAVTGDDSNPGTELLPFRTVNHAASVVEQGDTIFIHGGIYREAVHLKKNGHPYVPESLIRFRSTEKVWLRASDEFAPEWKAEGSGIYSASLPESLFEDGAYNPFALSQDMTREDAVRPGTTEPVRGLLWADGEELGYSETLGTAFSFRVSEDGRRISIRLPDGKSPADYEWEISIRRKVFYPEFSGPMFYETMGIVVEHAVEPGAFDGYRKKTVHVYHETGMTVRKCWIGGRQSGNFSIPFCGLAALDVDSFLLGITQYEDINGLSSREKGVDFFRFTPSDMSKTPYSVPAELASGFISSIPGEGIVRRLWIEKPKNDDPDYFVSGAAWKNYCAESCDGGKTWSEKQQLPGDERFYFEPILLQDGTYMWPYSENEHLKELSGSSWHQRVGAIIGRREGNGINWEQGGVISVKPDESDCGLAEPHAAQFPDGRIVMLLRSGARLAGDGTPGVTSGKMYSVSEDGGRTWSKPTFLRYEDGKIVYSPRSYQDIFTSPKNGRVYAILNIANEPCVNCDPRTLLVNGELEPATLALKRNTLTAIEKKHSEHNNWVRFSNWRQVLTNDGSLLMFMSISSSEYNSVRHGWDKSLYCYKIDFQ